MTLRWDEDTNSSKFIAARKNANTNSGRSWRFIQVLIGRTLNILTDNNSPHAVFIVASGSQKPSQLVGRAGAFSSFLVSVVYNQESDVF